MSANDVSKEVHFRGSFISVFVDIEYVLSDILACILVNGDQNLKMSLLEFVNPKLILKPKVELLIKILKSKYKVTYKEYEKGLDDLKKLCDLRNDFAHKRIEINHKNKSLHFCMVASGKHLSHEHKYSELDTKFKRLQELLSSLVQLSNKMSAI